ncbi:MAG: acyltransferase [Gammaproteobacteria bacterium]
MTTPSYTRNPRIDFLKGISILLVLISHFSLFYSFLPEKEFFLYKIAVNGYYGVMVFFVISGFLITSLALERYQNLGQFDLKSFYIFRFSRIFPPLLLAIGVICYFYGFGISGFENQPLTNGKTSVSFPLAILSILTFWFNEVVATGHVHNGVLTIFWSLSIEEVFYLAFPWVCLLLKKHKYIMMFCVALILFGPLHRYYLGLNTSLLAKASYFSCFDAIAMGCLTALIIKRVKWSQSWRTVIQTLAWLMGIAVYFSFRSGEFYVWGNSLISLSTSLLLLCVSQASPSKNRLAAGIRWCGLHCYELYLFHLIVLTLLANCWGMYAAMPTYEKLMVLAVYLLSSFALARIIAKFYSVPLNKGLRSVLTGKLSSKKTFAISK